MNEPHRCSTQPRTDFFGNRGSTGFAVLAELSPVISEPLLLPGDDGSRLDKCRSPLPTGPQPGKPGPEQAIRWAKLRAVDALLVDCDLMTQGDEFHLHRATRPEPG
jgi:hypothetical protein